MLRIIKMIKSKRNLSGHLETVKKKKTMKILELKNVIAKIKISLISSRFEMSEKELVNLNIFNSKERREKCIEKMKEQIFGGR